jgi:hypothetical protein
MSHRRLSCCPRAARCNAVDRSVGRGLAALAVGGAMVLSATQLSAQAFNGAVTYQVAFGAAAGATPGTLIISTKGDRTRMDMTLPDGGAAGGMAAMMGHSISMISDDASHSSTTLFNDKKMYVTHATSPTELEDLAKRAHGAGDSTAPPKFTKGKTEIIAGVSCDDYIFARTEGAGQEQTLICTAHGMGFLGGAATMSRIQQMGAAADPALLQEFKDGFFPLKIAKLDGGKETVEMLATKVDHTSVPDAAFTVPPGYTPFKMGGMGMAGPQ